jgi:uncharacterized surface protein with fasciclin (FAS1) repeats
MSAAKAADKPLDTIQTATGNGSFKTLVAAVKAAGLVDTLKGSAPFTVFEPADDAFAKLPSGTLENLLKPENKKQIVAILTYHVVPGKVMSKGYRRQEDDGEVGRRRGDSDRRYQWRES